LKINIKRKEFNLLINKRSLIMKEFLCKLEFISGEHGVPFYHIVKARTIKSAENKIDKWLRQFYGDEFDEKDGSTYYYLGSQVAVELDGIDLLDKDNFIRFISIN